MRRSLVGIVLFLGAAGPVYGQLGPLIYSQAPNRAFGYTSDTAFVDDLGHLNSEAIADRFTLNQTNTIQQVVFYGFYGTQNLGFDPDPPATESFIIRFYNQNGTFPPSLPPADQLLDEVHADVSRALTGNLVFPGRREYQYVVNLNELFSATGGVPYWLSILQTDDQSSTFRWETSPGGENAFQFPIGSPWVVSGGSQLAYELRVPEPSGAVVFVVGVLWAAARRSRRLERSSR